MMSHAPADLKRKRGRPRQDEGPDPEQILKAALSAFAKYGWAGTYLRKIAKVAGVDSSLIVRRYDGKMGLWRAIVDNVSCTLKRWQAMDEQTDLPVRDRLCLMIEGFVGISLDQPDLGRFFIDQISEVGERRTYVIEQIWSVHRGLVMPLLKEAEAEGVLPPGCNADIYHSILVGAVAMPLLTRTVSLPGIDTAQQREAFLHNILSLFAMRESATHGGRP